MNHAHGQSLLAAGMAPTEAPIQVKGHPGQVAHVLQQGKKGEEDGHGRQHDGYYPADNLVYAVQQAALQPGGSVQCAQKLCQSCAAPGEQAAEPLGRVVGTADGKPEDDTQQQKHDRDSGPFAQEQLIEPTVGL